MLYVLCKPPDANERLENNLHLGWEGPLPSYSRIHGRQLMRSSISDPGIALYKHPKKRTTAQQRPATMSSAPVVNDNYVIRYMNKKNTVRGVREQHGKRDDISIVFDDSEITVTLNEPNDVITETPEVRTVPSEVNDAAIGNGLLFSSTSVPDLSSLDMPIMLRAVGAELGTRMPTNYYVGKSLAALASQSLTGSRTSSVTMQRKSNNFNLVIDNNYVEDYV